MMDESEVRTSKLPPETFDTKWYRKKNRESNPKKKSLFNVPFSAMIGQKFVLDFDGFLLPE